MRPLLALSARFTLVALAAVLALGLVGGGIRLLPWLVAPDVPLALSMPFARRLAQSAAEVAVLVGVPAGVAAATARFTERGEARALFSLGASPPRLVASLLPPFLAFALAYAAVSPLLRSESPGRFAAALVTAGRDGCAEAGRGRVEVPLVGVTWLCFRAAPRLVGRIPGLVRDAWFSAGTVRPSEDLRQIVVEDLRVATRVGTRDTGVHARHARISGLPGWGAAPGREGPVRAFCIAAAAWAIAAFAAWLVLRLDVPIPVGAAATAAIASAAMVGVLQRLDRENLAPAAYALVPLVGMTVTGVGMLAVRRVRGVRARVARLRAR